MVNFRLLLCLFLATSSYPTQAYKLNRKPGVGKFRQLFGPCENYIADYTLPRNVKPLHYDLTLIPDLEQFTFEGEESIRVRIVGNDVRQITIHTLFLDIKEVTFITQENELQVVKRTNSVKSQTETFFFDEPLPRSGKLKLKFSGIISDVLQGFYRSKYTRQYGTDGYIALTQFEPTYARRAFPSFDEPALKSTFSLTLVVSKKLTALSNMPEMSSTSYPKDDSLRVVKYETTPKMSTYLLAVVIGEFDSIEGKTDSGMPVRVFVPKGRHEEGKFALSTGIRALNYYAAFLSTPLPLPKMDMISVNDFAFSAMENWGLITFREAALLLDEEEGSILQRQLVAIDVAHELAHQYFGDLVTMKWWNDIWLNEGFATFMCFRALHEFFPEWQTWRVFDTENYAEAMNLDALYNSHPLQVPIDKADNIVEVFDDIVYDKGASVLRLLRDWIGEDTLRKGLKLYLRRYKFSNTCSKDLWNTFEDVSKLPVKRVMTKWTKQKGFPLLKVSEIRRSGDESVIKVCQEKFAANAGLTKKARKTRWELRLKYTTQSNKSASILDFNKSEKCRTLAAPHRSRTEWFKLDILSIGFYRTKYSNQLMSRLIPAIRSQELSPTDRLQLQSDYFALARAGYVSTDNFLKFLMAYHKDTDYFVLFSISNSLTSLGSLLSYTDYKDKFKAYGLNFFNEIAKNTSWESHANEDDQQALLRGLVANSLCQFESQSAIKKVRSIFTEHTSHGVRINPNLRAAIYENIASMATDDEFDQLLKMYIRTNNAANKDELGKALGSVENKTHIKKVLDFSLSSDVRSRDTRIILTTLSGSKRGRELTWRFFKKNKKVFLARYANDSTLGDLIKGIAEKFASEDKAREVETFFKENDFPGTDWSVRRTVESIRLNANWLSRDTVKIKKYLMQSL